MAGLSVRLLPTPGYHGYNVKFSPFEPSLVAVAASQNFGLSGGGRLIIVDLNLPETGVVCSCDWKDGLFDLTWSEHSPTHVITASGDSSLQLWDTAQPQAPRMVYQDHQKEVYSVEWNQTRDHQLFVSASWDATIRLWDPNNVKCVGTLTGHQALVYQAAWSPHIPSCVASVAGDGTLRVWNTRTQGKASVTVQVCAGEVLSCDWCKYDQNVIATAATDGNIQGWDLRSPLQPLFVLKGHGYPVRRVKFSPFHESQLSSVSYDFTTRLWDYKLPAPCLSVMENHTEFVYGLDHSVHQEGTMADCSWDQSVGIYSLDQGHPPPPALPGPHS